MPLFRIVPAQVRTLLSRVLGGILRQAGPPPEAARDAGLPERGETARRALAGGGAALRRTGRFDEADSLLGRGLALFPGDAALLYEHAFNAHAAGRYAVAVERWEAALAAAPDLAMCHAGVAANLRELGNLERAAAIIEEATGRFPDDLTVLTEAARIADARLRFDLSLPLWQRAAAAPGAAPEWHQGEIHALVRLGRFAEAEGALTAAHRRFPEDAGLIAVAALLATERRDWPRAIALWSDYRRRYPHDRIGAEQLARARRGAGSDAPQRAPAKAGGVDLGTLLLGFESLGDSREFGIVQRRCGAEPESLLRWADVASDGLVAALDARFAGLADPANTSMEVASDGCVVLRDHRWGLALGGLPLEEEGEQEPRFAAARREAARLRDQLLGDLEAGEKTFVFRSPGLEPDRLDALHRALRRYGPVRLLEVRPAAPTAHTLLGGVAGEVVAVEPGRYVGFLERLGSAEDDGTWDIALEDWIAICRKVAAMSA